MKHSERAADIFFSQVVESDPWFYVPYWIKDFRHDGCGLISLVLCVDLLTAKLVDFWHYLIVFFRLVDGIAIAKYTSSLGTNIKLIAKLSHFFVHFAVVYECHLIGFIENVFDLVVL